MKGAAIMDNVFYIRVTKVSLEGKITSIPFKSLLQFSGYEMNKKTQKHNQHRLAVITDNLSKMINLSGTYNE